MTCIDVLFRITKGSSFETEPYLTCVNSGKVARYVKLNKNISSELEWKIT